MSKKNKRSQFTQPQGPTSPSTAQFDDNTLEDAFANDPQNEVAISIADTFTEQAVSFVKNLGLPWSYNPDELVTRKGLGVLEDMSMDDIIKPTLNLKKNVMLSMPWKIEAASSAQVDQDAAAMIEWNLRTSMKESLRSYLKEAMTSYDFGFSVNEKNYEIIKYGPWAGKIGLKEIKTRQPNSFYFEYDSYGNLISIKQDQTMQGKQFMKPLNPCKFWIMTNERKFQNLYGMADTRGAYPRWFQKDIIIKYWCIHLERFSTPLLLFTHPSLLTNAQKTQLKTVMRLMQHSSALRLPSYITVKDIQFTPNLGYIDAVKYLDTAIARSLDIPDLIGFTATSFGSYALGEKQFNLLYTIIEEKSLALAESFANDVIVDIVDKNFNVYMYPKLKFLEIVNNDRNMLMKLYALALNAGVASPRFLADMNIFRTSLGLPTIEEDTLQQYFKPLAKPGVVTLEDAIVDATPDIAAREGLLESVAEIKTMFGEAGPEPLNSYINKNYPALREKLNMNLEKVSQEIIGESSKFYDEFNIGALRDMKPDLSKLKSTIKDELQQAFELGKKTTESEE